MTSSFFSKDICDYFFFFHINALSMQQKCTNCIGSTGQAVLLMKSINSEKKGSQKRIWTVQDFSCCLKSRKIVSNNLSMLYLENIFRFCRVYRHLCILTSNRGAKNRLQGRFTLCLQKQPCSCMAVQTTINNRRAYVGITSERGG